MWYRPCSAFNCTNTTEKGQSMSFFRFPKDRERSRQWIMNSRREDLMKTNPNNLHNNYRLCSAHFEDNQFLNPCIKNRLIWNAIPTIFNIPSLPLRLEVLRTCCSCNSEGDKQTVKKRLKIDDDDNLQSKLTSVQVAERSMFGVVKESSFSQTSPQIRHQLSITLQNYNSAMSKTYQHLRKSLGEPYLLASLHSLPENLVLRQSSLHRDYFGIWCREDISQGTRFGPYNGILINNPEEQVAEVNNERKMDDSSSNWLEYINHAFKREQQNLVAFQFQGQIFYISCMHIPANTELLAGYKYGHGSIERKKKFESHKVPLIYHKSYEYNAWDKKCSVQCNLKLQDIIDNKIKLYESDEYINKFRNCSIEERICTERIPNECNIYNKPVTQIISLQRHKIFQTAKKSFVCDVCGKNFGQHTGLKRHHKLLHTGVKPSKCSECEKVFKQTYNLKIHQRRVHSGEKPYKCDKCEKKFAESAELKKHQNRFHIKENPYGCNECGKTFALNFDLKLHKRNHIKEKTFECNICGKKFAQNISLKRHKTRLHSAEKLYECDECEKKYAINADLNQHKKCHIKGKTYECDDCGKKYALHSSLKRHRKIHAEEKPYKCDLQGNLQKIIF